MKSACVYKITSKATGKQYVGSATNGYRRMGKHLWYFKNGCHPNSRLKLHINAFGVDDMVFEVIEPIADGSLLLSREQYYIDLLRPEFNIDPNAGSSLGAKRSVESRKKIGKIQKEKMTPEMRKRISEANKKRYLEGRKPPALGKFGFESSVGKPVCIIELGVTFGSKLQAARFLNEKYFPNRSPESIAQSILDIQNGKIQKKHPFENRFNFEFPNLTHGNKLF